MRQGLNPDQILWLKMVFDGHGKRNTQLIQIIEKKMGIDRSNSAKAHDQRNKIYYELELLLYL